ncbi:hypothetical protein DPMN_011115 [Dreissena polymorpha]|uniref:Uncharacterized protein n=1 Tax=Dreissena polymorpha TaxID=45954 RepID=A0A9D4S1J4_DREPO|nr:hypothetical protein DPMN_011115 [Dreissena polymorpha]
MNLLTQFHEDWTINVASIEKNAPPLGSHVFQAKVTILKLIQDFIGTNLLTKFHEDQKINVASRVNKGHNCHKTRFSPPARPPASPLADIRQTYNQYFSSKNQVKNAPPPGDHVFQPTGINFKLVQDMNGMNLLTKFHEDQTINLASKVKNAPPLGSHVFQANITIFELIQDIIETNLLTKFHEDWTINVASRELTRQMLTAHDGQKAITKAYHEHKVLR